MVGDVRRIVEREGALRFADGTALLNHHFVKLGFLDGWREIDPQNERTVFTELLERLNGVARSSGELRLTIPKAYVEAAVV